MKSERERERVGGLILNIAHVRNRRFGNGERQAFNKRCKAAGLDDLLKDWSNKADALRHNVKPGVTKEHRRLEIEAEEASAYARPVEALPTDEQTLVHVLDVKATGEDTNALVTEALPLLRDLHKVCVLGQTIGGSRGHAANVQVRHAKAALTTRGEAAREEAKDDKMAKMTERVEQYEALRARKEHAMLEHRAGSELSSSSKGATPIRASTKKGATAAAKAAKAALDKEEVKPAATSRPNRASKKTAAKTAAVVLKAVQSVSRKGKRPAMDVD
jgi:hypothetical protein